MRRLTDLFALLLCVVGILFALASCGLGSIGHDAASFSFWLGIALILTGALISRAASLKTCPECAERVKVKALKCKHCGSELAA
jgi:hypothetical protein